jgi:hypothetical protein
MKYGFFIEDMVAGCDEMNISICIYTLRCGYLYAHIYVCEYVFMEIKVFDICFTFIYIYISIYIYRSV